MRFTHLVTLALAACLSVGLTAVSAEASPKGQLDVRAQVELLLRGYHGLPERSRFEAVTPEVAKHLRDIARDPMAGPMQTAALEALKWWPDAETMAVYQQALAPENRRGVRYKTVRYLAAFGADAVPVAAQLMSDADPMVRRLAGTLLFELPGDAAGKALFDAAGKESDPAVKAELDGLLRTRASIR